ncbi:MAG TPA: PAS domain-containing sensor histidine kinase [archaeon]|nr:PAS domain-containing sensor histidine kinase [archaeon]
MDNAVKNFLKNVANTVLKLEIISYYYEHPFTLDNAEGLARWLNRKVEDVTSDLEELVEKELLVREGERETAVYSYHPDRETSALVDKVVSSYRLTRDAVCGEVLKLEKKQEELRKEYQALLFTERGKTETILNSMEEAVVVLNRTGKVLLANEQLLRRFVRAKDIAPGGAALEELVGEGFVAQAVRSSLERMEKGEESLDFSYAERCYKIQSVPVTGPDLQVIEDQEGHPVATVTVFRDVTREREIESMREDFISMLTHDLKNPLGIILGSSTLIIDGKLGILSEKQHKLLSNVVKSCDTMNMLIEDFLTLSRLEAGKLNLCIETVNINDLLQSTLQLFEVQIRDRNLKAGFSTDCEKVRVLGDSIQLDRVVSNLIGNAVKYNREGGRIDVYSVEDGPTVRVDVADTGQGIPEDELPFVFEKFRRASSVKSVKGTGLGLTISRELVTAMGGEIWVKNRESEGCCFSFRLPKAPDQAAPC